METKKPEKSERMRETTHDIVTMAIIGTIIAAITGSIAFIIGVIGTGIIFMTGRYLSFLLEQNEEKIKWDKEEAERRRKSDLGISFSRS